MTQLEESATAAGRVAQNQLQGIGLVVRRGTGVNEIRNTKIPQRQNVEEFRPAAGAACINNPMGLVALSCHGMR